MTRPVAWALSLCLALCAAGCDRARGERVRVLNLMERTAAERRPVDGPFEMREFSCGGDRRPAFGVPASSRVIWSTQLPSRAVLSTAVGVEGRPGAAVLFRVGISDDRIYEGLASVRVTAGDCGRGWTPLEVDLADYSGVKFSLFYQPNHRTWRLVLATNVEEGAVAAAWWAQPAIEADTAAAREYIERLREAGRR